MMSTFFALLLRGFEHHCISLVSGGFGLPDLDHRTPRLQAGRAQKTDM